MHYRASIELHQIPRSQTALWSVLLALLMSCTSQPEPDPITIQGTTVPPVPTLNRDQIEQGELLYATYCASCHGNELEGEPNWQRPKEDGSFAAPPHDETGHTWHHPDDQLLEIIASGGDPAFGGTMPGFGTQLNQDQMLAILDFIKSHWRTEDREFQWWISNREPGIIPEL